MSELSKLIGLLGQCKPVYEVTCYNLSFIKITFYKLLNKNILSQKGVKHNQIHFKKF